MNLLDVKDLTMRFGGLTAVDRLTFHINEGEVLGLIGPNGAGKSTSIDCISGFHPGVEGEVRLAGKDITGRPPHVIAAMGLSRTFQLTHLFGSNTVLESVMTGLHLMEKPSLWDTFRPFHGRAKQEHIRHEAFEILKFLGLDDIPNAVCKNISNYARKLLGLAIALATDPKLILIDELVSGLSAEETNAIIDQIKTIRDAGRTILLVEHNMRVIMRLCDRIVVLNFGAKLTEGIPEAVVQNEAVQKAYLGEALDA